MGFRGAGGPPPPRKGGFGGRPKTIHFFQEKVKGKSGPEMKQLRGFKVYPGLQDVPIVTLDHGTDIYSTFIHSFQLKGSFDNVVVCPSPGEDDPPCPLCLALNKRGAWNGVLTVVDRSKWSPTEGKNKGKVYTDNRKLALIGTTTGKEKEELARKCKDLHGFCFDVSRPKPTPGEDGKLDWKGSPRIGLWFPVKTLGQEELKSTFERAAADYGMSLEEFVEPANYEAVFKPKSLEQLKAIAKDIVSDLSAIKASQAGQNDAESVGATADNDEAEISY